MPPRLRQQHQQQRHHRHQHGNNILPPPDAPPAPPKPAPPGHELPFPTDETAAAAAAAELAAGGNGGSGVGGSRSVAEVINGEDQGSRLLERAFVLIGQEMIGHRTKLGKHQLAITVIRESLCPDWTVKVWPSGKHQSAVCFLLKKTGTISTKTSTLFRYVLASL